MRLRTLLASRINSLALLTGKASNPEDGRSLRWYVSIRLVDISSVDKSDVDSDSCNADPLLHNLQPDDQLHAATSMKLSTTNAEKH